VSDETSILRVAEDERDNAERLMNEHIRSCKHHGCPQCRSLTAHFTRCERQVELLTAPEGHAEEVLF
jgi:hypothetical protein